MLKFDPNTVTPTNNRTVNAIVSNIVITLGGIGAFCLFILILSALGLVS